MSRYALILTALLLAGPVPAETGDRLYSRICAACHGGAEAAPGIDIPGKDLREIETALREIEEMRDLQLPQAEVEAIAAFLSAGR
ncbi:cytochrome c [Tropicimonas sp. TH_r6]|uniref:c-type cytochrome n=1 Tax=Tropicimonas sp. TH_r6 TaxID=3082085 RepID=UPI0029559370|nr:cytochrome c [Tropicimonas sp. TH_r6]MDV7143707.1 cytochrome c [Tropicimonas sp. TH_r6]